LMDGGGGAAKGRRRESGAAATGPGRNDARVYRWDQRAGGGGVLKNCRDW
jgi:hypothetical protein